MKFYLYRVAHSVRRLVSRGAVYLQNYYFTHEYKHNFNNLEAYYTMYIAFKIINNYNF